MDAPIYLPATKNRPATPAPLLLTQAETLRMLRLSARRDGYQVLYRFRQQGLVDVKIGNEVRFMLSDVVAFIQSRRDKAAEFASKVASNAPRNGKTKATNRPEAQC